MAGRRWQPELLFPMVYTTSPIAWAISRLAPVMIPASLPVIRYWWNSYGKIRYFLATSILLLYDGGGSNSSRYYIFKQDLQALCQ